MAAGTEREREALLNFAEQLCGELGYPNAATPSAEAHSLAAAGAREGIVGMLSPEDETLVRELRSGLARLAVAVAAGLPPNGAPTNAVRVALDGAELVMRGELIGGNGTELGTLIPGFVYLVTLPMIEQEEALDLSRRTGELIEAVLAN